MRGADLKLIHHLKPSSANLLPEAELVPAKLRFRPIHTRTPSPSHTHKVYCRESLIWGGGGFFKCMQLSLLIEGTETLTWKQKEGHCGWKRVSEWAVVTVRKEGARSGRVL